MELESLKTHFDVFGMTYDQYVEGKTNTVFSNEIYFACFGKHLEHIRNESNS
jgi:hypothetical protein